MIGKSTVIVLLLCSVIGCASSEDAICDRAASVLATCGKTTDQSPFGTCQPEQQQLAEAVVRTYDAQGCAALSAPKADSAVCKEMPMLCVTHTAAELAPFTTDGCSMFPDGTPSNRALWQHCCVTHDFAYYVGGSSELRAAADAALETCVASETTPLLGSAMRAGVRMGGTPALPTPWRWGYGWRYDPFNGYRDVPSDQMAAAQRAIDAYKANPTPPYALEQRLSSLWDSIVKVPGLESAMDNVQEQIDAVY